MTEGVSGEILDTRSWRYQSARLKFVSRAHTTHVDKCFPFLPEIAVSDHADRVAQLCLYIRRTRYHETNDLTLDVVDLILRELVISVLIYPSAADEVFEVQRGSQAAGLRKGIRANNLKQCKREAWTLFCLLDRSFSWRYGQRVSFNIEDQQTHPACAAEGRGSAEADQPQPVNQP